MSSAEVIDLRSLVPLDIETVFALGAEDRPLRRRQPGDSHRQLTPARSPRRFQELAFDYLDAPVKRVGAKNGIAPQSHVLERRSCPSVDDLVAAANSIL